MLSIFPLAAIVITNNPKALSESIMYSDDLYRNVNGILFLGTSHRGLELAKIVSTLVSIVCSLTLGSKSLILK